MKEFSLMRGLPFVDSFFTSGGYAYSSGLETAVQEGALRPENCQEYLDQYLRFGVARQDALAVALIHRFIQDEKIDGIEAVDWQLEAMKPCQQLREASRQMGRQVIRIAADQLDHPFILQIHEKTIQEQIPCHYPLALGAVLGACGWSEREVVQAFLYQTISGWVSALLRLLPMGHQEGQRLIHALLPSMMEITQEVEVLNIGDMSSWAGLHDIRSMRHGRLRVRLFRS